jgi:hypothetical protein
MFIFKNDECPTAAKQFLSAGKGKNYRGHIALVDEVAALLNMSRKRSRRNNIYMKTIIAILSAIMGGYMLIDGIFVMLKGKYIGPERPGPWANLFYSLGINVMRLGPLFIAFGILWLCWLYALLTSQSWAYSFGIVLSLLSLWYLPVGTLISIIVLIALLAARHKLGL